MPTFRLHAQDSKRHSFELGFTQLKVADGRWIARCPITLRTVGSHFVYWD